MDTGKTEKQTQTNQEIEYEDLMIQLQKLNLSVKLLNAAMALVLINQSMTKNVVSVEIDPEQAIQFYNESVVDLEKHNSTIG